MEDFFNLVILIMTITVGLYLCSKPVYYGRNNIKNVSKNSNPPFNAKVMNDEFSQLDLDYTKKIDYIKKLIQIEKSKPSYTSFEFDNESQGLNQNSDIHKKIIESSSFLYDLERRKISNPIELDDVDFIVSENGRTEDIRNTIYNLEFISRVLVSKKEAIKYAEYISLSEKYEEYVKWRAINN